MSRANRKTTMDSFKRILAVTDLSIPARHAAQRAALVGRDTSTPLELLHVAQLAPLVRMRRLMSTVTSNFEQEVIEAAERKLRELAAALETQYGVNPSFRVTQGSLLSELAKESGSLKDGLLVCGARGESVVRHFVMGSTALRLLNSVTCSILVVKQLPHEPYRKALVPVDFSPSSRRAVEQAKRLAPHSEFTLLHAFEAPFEGHLRYASVDESTIQHYLVAARNDAQQKLRELRDEAGLSAKRCKLLVVHGNPVLSITQHEVELDADLIVMGKYGESLLEDVILGSVTRHVLTECQCDVLVAV